MEVIFFSAQPFVGVLRPPTPPIRVNKVSYLRIGTIPNLHLDVFFTNLGNFYFLNGEFECEPKTSKFGFNHLLQVTNVQFYSFFVEKHVSFFSRFGCYYLCGNDV